MFGRKMPCETTVPGRLKYADAGLNNLIGLSIMGFDPYAGNQKFTTLLIELSGDTNVNISFSVRRSYTDSSSLTNEKDHHYFLNSADVCW